MDSNAFECKRADCACMGEVTECKLPNFVYISIVKQLTSNYFIFYIYNSIRYRLTYCVCDAAAG
jgi:hypothetical protein